MNPRTVPGAAEIIDVCCELCYVPIARLVTGGRAPRVVQARTLCCALLRSMCAMSHNEIARAVRTTSHSTVGEAIRRSDRLLKSDPEFARLHAAALTRLTALSSNSEDTQCTFTPAMNPTPQTDRPSPIPPPPRA